MGDDDNDIEAASNSAEAYIAEPCSTLMKEWVLESMHSTESEDTPDERPHTTSSSKLPAVSEKRYFFM